MKILVLSDSHGMEGYVYDIMSRNTDSDLVIFLGDGEDDLDLSLSELPAFGNKRVIRVRGNNDFWSGVPKTTFETICGYDFYITHGHEQRVKNGTYLLLSDAKKNGRNVVLFGHTHLPFFEETDGIRLFNPGAVLSLHYGIINIDEKTGTIDFSLF